MDRKDFIIAFKLKNTKRAAVWCDLCYRHFNLKKSSLLCRGLYCNPQRTIEFDNRKHVPVITKKECRHTGCLKGCDYCMINENLHPKIIL